MISLHPFRTPPLTGAQVGWFRPAAAVVLALVIPCVIAIVTILGGAPTFSGLPKDGSGYTAPDHIAIFLGALAASFLVSWMMAPVALVCLRAAAMLGYAGWGTAILVALLFGMPVAHFATNGDITTEETSILPHVMTAVAFLGLSVWAAFWGLISLSQKSPKFPSK